MTTTISESREVPRAALRVNDACAVLGISRTKLYIELASGRLKARKSGSRTLIPVEAADAWLRSLPAFHASKAA